MKFLNDIVKPMLWLEFEISHLVFQRGDLVSVIIQVTTLLRVCSFFYIVLQIKKGDIEQDLN